MVESFQLREHREHDDPVFDQSVQLREASGGEGGDGVRPVPGRALRLQAPQEPHVRVHDQLHPQAEEPAREVHDEQRARELHNPAGEKSLNAVLGDPILTPSPSSGDHEPGHPGDPLVHRLRLRGLHLRARRPAPHLQARQGLAALVRRLY